VAREDHAGRLYDALVARFGEEHIFMDIDTIEPGVDFSRVVDEHVGACDVLIALIGRQWAAIADRSGTRRPQKPEDDATRDCNFDIYVMDADGQNIRRLTTSPGAEQAPDGRRTAARSPSRATRAGTMS
jgi:hypothetical protein